MKKFLFLLALASCEGRCDANDAAMDVVGPGANCLNDEGGPTSVRVICLHLSKVYGCSTDGVFFKTARCIPIGTLNTETP